MGRPKGSKNNPKTAQEAPPSPSPEVQVKEKPKRAQKAVKTPGKAIGDKGPSLPEAPGAALAPQRVIVDLLTGEQLGPDRSLDLTKSGRKHYSHSFVKTIGSCTAQAYFKTIKAEARKVFAMERGSVVHNLLEAYIKENKDPIEGLPDMWRMLITDNLEKMSEADREKAAKSYEETELMLVEWLVENRQDFKDRGVRPEDAEVEFLLDVPLQIGDKKFTRPFMGKIDLILWNADKTKGYIIDYKTSATAPSEDELGQETQFALYSWAFKQLYGFKPSGMTFYLLKGQHGCPVKFSAKAHPRDPLHRVSGCWINYALKVPIPSDERIQELFDSYYAPNILKFEAGIVGKDGRSDFRNKCARCEYRETCDQVRSFPPPVFI